MVDIQFDEGQVVPSRREVEKKPSYIVSLLLNAGVTKDAKQANYMLVGFAVLGILASIFIFWNLSASQESEEIPSEVLRQMR